MRHLVLLAFAFLLTGFITSRGVAQTRTCNALTDPQKRTVQEIFKTQRPHDCCDATLLECLGRKPVCPLVTRLANDVCRRAALGQSRGEIERELMRRAASVIAPKVSIDLSSASVAGESSARVEIVAYVCARCPYCSKLIPQLHQSVTQGKLRGKAKLLIRPFPIRSHKHSTLGAKAMLAAERLGQFWPFLLHLYAHFDRFAPERIVECAAGAGLDAARFRALVDDPDVERMLVRVKKEGVRNHVEATPSLFIDGRFYSADLSLPAVEDFVEERDEAH